MEVVLTGVAVLSLVATLVLGVLSTKTASRSASAAEASSEAAQRSLDVAAEQLRTSTAAQNESLRLAREQLASAVAAQAAATQPYVWADLRSRDDAGMLVLVVGNTGPTVATDVRLVFEPPLRQIVPKDRADLAAEIEKKIGSGIGSVAPGRTFVWNLGVTYAFFPDPDAVPALKVTVTAIGPAGALDPLSYPIDLEDLRHQAARPSGLAVLEAPLKKIDDHLGKIARALPKLRP